MATRFYFPASTTAAPLISPAVDASWEVTASVQRGILDTQKLESAFATKAVATTSNTPAGAVDVVLGQFISAPLNGDQTISGAIKGIVRAAESNTAADLRSQCVIRVLSGDGSTVRGTLIASDESVLSNEWNLTTLRNIKFPLNWTGSGQTPTTVNALDGDRIVVELGYRKHENATTSRTGSLAFGAVSGGTDCAENETDTTTNVGWIEFADTLAFDATPVRLAQAPVEVAILPTDAKARVAQMVVEVAILPSAPERVTVVWIS